MAQEVELKLAFPPDSLKHITKHPLIAGAQRVGRAQTLENTYFDTPEELLGKARIALRTRRIGRRWLQTIKCAHASAGGLSSRPEWEQAFKDHFDFSQIDDETTRDLLEEHANDIAPLFTTNFRRETREYSPRHGVRILMMIDSGNILAADREAPIAELELELVEGHAADLLDLAIKLATDLPLMPEDISKAERGYLLFHNAPARARRAERVWLDDSMSPHEAFRKLALEGLRCWQANALGALLHDDAEFIHQLRVALRRLRTLLRIFEAQLPNGFATSWQTSLAALTADIGAVRDLDVMHDSLLSSVHSAEAPDIQSVLTHLHGVQQVARERARQTLHSTGSRLLLLEFSKAIHALPIEASELALRRFATDRLRRLHKRVHSNLQRAQTSSHAENLHSLRIAAKRLRYATEFFTPLFSAASVTRFQRKLAPVLDQLGLLNDLVVGQMNLRQWLSVNPQLRDATVWISAWHAAQSRRRARNALRATEKLIAAKPPWKYARHAKRAK